MDTTKKTPGEQTLVPELYFQLLSIDKKNFKILLNSIRFYTSYFIRNQGKIDIEILDDFPLPNINYLEDRVKFINLVKLFKGTNLFKIVEDLVNFNNIWVRNNNLSEDDLLTVVSLPDAIVEKALLQLSEDPIKLKEILVILQSSVKEAP